MHKIQTTNIRFWNDNETLQGKIFFRIWSSHYFRSCKMSYKNLRKSYTFKNGPVNPHNFIWKSSKNIFPWIFLIVTYFNKIDTSFSYWSFVRHLQSFRWFSITWNSFITYIRKFKCSTFRFKIKVKTSAVFRSGK